MENGQPASVTLRPLTGDHVPIALPWFDDPETQRQLGGRGWLKKAVAMADAPLGEFRGAVETGRYRWLALDGEFPVGYIDCGTYDRWTTWDGERVVDSIEVPCAAIAYTVDPTFRRHGYGRQILETLFEAPEVAASGQAETALTEILNVPEERRDWLKRSRSSCLSFQVVAARLRPHGQPGHSRSAEHGHT
jgi:GNAT superfamily N-acetyltransferase